MFLAISLSICASQPGTVRNSLWSISGKRDHRRSSHDSGLKALAHGFDERRSPLWMTFLILMINLTISSFGVKLRHTKWSIQAHVCDACVIPF